MKIVVRAPNWIGDSVLAIPSIAAISQNHPRDQIWVAASPWVEALFRGLDFIAGTIALPPATGLRSLIRSAGLLRDRNFEAGLLLTNSFASALQFYLARIPQRWGYDRDGRGFLLTKKLPPPKKEHRTHQVRYYMNLVSGLGFQALPPQLLLPLLAEERQAAVEMLTSLRSGRSGPLVILNPGGFYGSAKRWPASRFSELAGLLQDRHGADIAIVGTAKEIPLAEEIAGAMRQPPLVLSGRTTLRDLAAVISLASLFVSNDSGPMHMANAIGTPVVAVFGPTDAQATGPFQAPSEIVRREVPCWPCLYRDCPIDHRCMMEIRAEDVYQACRRLLA